MLLSWCIGQAGIGQSLPCSLPDSSSYTSGDSQPTDVLELHNSFSSHPLAWRAGGPDVVGRCCRRRRRRWRGGWLWGAGERAAWLAVHRAYLLVVAPVVCLSVLVEDACWHCARIRRRNHAVSHMSRWSDTTQLCFVQRPVGHHVGTYAEQTYNSAFSEH